MDKNPVVPKIISSTINALFALPISSLVRVAVRKKDKNKSKSLNSLCFICRRVFVSRVTPQ